MLESQRNMFTTVLGISLALALICIFRMTKDTGIFRLQYSAFKLFMYNCIHDLTSSLCSVTSSWGWGVISFHNGGHDKHGYPETSAPTLSQLGQFHMQREWVVLILFPFRSVWMGTFGPWSTQMRQHYYHGFYKQFFFLLSPIVSLLER